MFMIKNRVVSMTAVIRALYNSFKKKFIPSGLLQVRLYVMCIFYVPDVYMKIYWNTKKLNSI
jgi:hypothetical protein